MSASTQPAPNTIPQWDRQRLLVFATRYGIFLVLIVMIAVISILTPIIRGEQYFLTPRNLIQVALQASINAIIAVGMTFVITSGGIDLSVGSIVALCGVVAALAMRDLEFVGPWLGFLIAVLVGAACGFFNGLLIVGVKLPPERVLMGISAVLILLIMGSMGAGLAFTLPQMALGAAALAVGCGALFWTLHQLARRSIVGALWIVVIALSLIFGWWVALVTGAGLTATLMIAFLALVVVGVVQIFLVANIALPPFIATLGTLGIFRGLALIISDGRPIYGFGREFLQTFSVQYTLSGTGATVTLFVALLTALLVGTAVAALTRKPRYLSLGALHLPMYSTISFVLALIGWQLISRVMQFSTFDLPVAVIISFGVAFVGWLIFTRTRFGKYTIAIGGNEETSRLSGIRVKRYKLGVYTLAGILTGIAAALLLARLSSGDPTFGQLFELDAIAASVMGGTSLTGGEGSIAGTMVGALIISLVRNAMNIFNLPSYYQQIVIGAVIVLAVLLDQWRKQQTNRSDN